ncbi:hypothetical protein [Mycobacteroides abscessus]|uniref:hypothetical protein n=1 Tax=Mycobacteroides abscessus TaxID=36809 RepID=UPI00092B8DCE|nr:hypothetical protein [Mycobacteroides abscessus]MDM3900429.1 hypothetical protein [Mycobacteroides abscessus]SHP06167.1 Uncharacterised protein [Mycobacteroides abscessus subsp. abscessus]SHQ44455.1 Uncharacterised protein [Mycobacteroides abscessus subsp. abscessus]SHQ86608.1 Uncharacterised protein [Mycobacteroides abscessus subsp. abscessus]SHQ95877.1 Uncharacterised protein [Mycobacteroides abscessus subsp. abscessus]
MSVRHEAVIAAANKIDPRLYEILTPGRLEKLAGLLEFPDKLAYQLRTLKSVWFPSLATTAKSDGALLTNKFIKDYTANFGRRFPRLAPAQIIYGKHADNSVVASMVDKAVEKSRREYFMAGDNLVPPTGKYLNLSRVKADDKSSLIAGKVPLDQIIEKCARDDYDYDHPDVKTAMAYALMAEHPEYRWLIQKQDDLDLFCELMNYAICGTQQRNIKGGKIGPGCDWPLSPGCDGRFSQAVYVIPFPRPSELVVFCKVCSTCWDSYVKTYQISGGYSSGLIAG